MQTVLSAAGGLGIFLLAMAMMTDGLKIFGGDRLKLALARWTSNPLKAVLTGALVTGLVQSSSAVTVATIGFVNAGILQLGQSLGVIFGANVGTTMTGWLVSLIGFGFKIEALALPIIAVGMAFRIATSNRRLRGLGGTLTGFGLFFLGLAILKEAFAGLSGELGTLTLATAGGGGSVIVFLLIGAAATVLTQSSSAAIALILTAASQSAIGLGVAAAAIIGANIGTTSTAALAVIGATPNARRVAAGHILFNLGTGVIALLILPLLLWLVEQLGELVGQGGRPAVVLALFHTVFNILGVVLMLPLIGWLQRHLENLFRTEEEDISRPRHLDRTVAATPALALSALSQELSRMHGIVRDLGFAASEADSKRADLIQRHAEAIRRLGLAVRSFAVSVRMEDMPREQAEALPGMLRISRYLEEAAELLSRMHTTAMEAARLPVASAGNEVRHLLRAARDCLGVCTLRSPVASDDPGTVEMRFEKHYQEAKAALLKSAAAHQLSIEDADRLLDAISGMRRMVEQVVKATLALRTEIAKEVRKSPPPANTGKAELSYPEFLTDDDARR